MFHLLIPQIFQHSSIVIHMCVPEIQCFNDGVIPLLLNQISSPSTECTLSSSALVSQSIQGTEPFPLQANNPEPNQESRALGHRPLHQASMGLQ